jgi:RecA/RadA recombinase
MAPRKQNNDIPDDPVQAAMAVMSTQAKKSKLGGVGFRTVADQSANWRWIDFQDPKTGQPCLLMEWLWGARGFLAGRMLKIEAEEGVGKSSFMMWMYGAAQKTCNAWCVHAEGELATAPYDFIASFGCDPACIMAPELDKRAIDECFNKLDWVAYQIRRPAAKEGDKVIDPEGKYPIIMGVDSVSSFGAAANMEDDGVAIASSQGGLGTHARFLSQWFRDKWSAQAKRDVFLMVIAQVRDKIDTGPSFPGGPPKKKEMTTLAARPLNFHCSYRLYLRASEIRHKDGPDAGKAYGELITFKVTKNKLSPKGNTIQIPLIWNHGFQMEEATVNLLNMLSPISLPNGSKFVLNKKAGGWIDVPMLQDKAFKAGSDAEILAGIYANNDLLMQLREALRIRGFGFEFETRYTQSTAEIEDSTLYEADTDDIVVEA